MAREPPTHRTNLKEISVSLTTTIPAPTECASPTDLVGHIHAAMLAGLPAPTTIGGLWVTPGSAPAVALAFGHDDLAAVDAWTGHLHATGCRIVAAWTGREFSQGGGFVHQLSVELKGWLGWSVAIRCTVDDAIVAPPCDCGSAQFPTGEHQERCAEVDAALAVIRAARIGGNR